MIKVRHWVSLRMFFWTALLIGALPARDLRATDPNPSPPQTAEIQKGKNRQFLEAALRGDLHQVEALLKQGADINVVDQYGNTAFIYAAVRGHGEVAQVLMKNGADLNATTKEGLTALDYSLRQNNGLAHYLSQNGALPNPRVLQAEKNWKLLKAASDGNSEQVEALLKDGAQVNAQDTNGRTALHFSAAKGHDGLVDLLIKKGADLNIGDKDGDTPLELANLKGQPAVVRMLSEKGGTRNPVRVQDEKNSLLLEAASAGNVEQMKKLIQDGADLNTKNGEGYSALHFAAASGHDEAVALLIDHKADVNSKNNKGQTPLDFSRKFGSKEVSQRLAKNGAKIGDPRSALERGAHALGGLERFREFKRNHNFVTGAGHAVKGVVKGGIAVGGVMIGLIPTVVSAALQADGVNQGISGAMTGNTTRMVEGALEYHVGANTPTAPQGYWDGVGMVWNSAGADFKKAGSLAAAGVRKMRRSSSHQINKLGSSVKKSVKI